MAAELDIELGGEPMRLLGDRALYWPARARLLIADLHLGKADVFRHAGIGLPAGGTLHDLDRLATLLAHTRATELWILGDVLHGPALASRWRESWEQWRAKHERLRIVALTGNHDRALRNAGLELTLAGAEVEDGPFALRHEPHPHPTLHVLCGHIHPLAALPGMRKRFPSFWLRESMTVLPAFSHFTAGVAPQLSAGERLVACVEGEAIALPPFGRSIAGSVGAT
ncbi:MAG: ligase-associated DNA damage response endonuclease PdeM [Pseudoxanthomonas sp.]